MLTFDRSTFPAPLLLPNVSTDVLGHQILSRQLNVVGKVVYDPSEKIERCVSGKEKKREENQN